eukprot:Colp12_sorted_trinity150504_noHs@14587
MAFMVFLGCTLVAFGPLGAIFIMEAARDPELIILTISSGFFWLLSIMASAIVYIIATTLQTKWVFSIFISVFFQELFRWFFYLLMTKAKKGLQLMENDPNSTTLFKKFALVSGLGFGLMSGLITLNPVLTESLGVGTLDSPGCPGTSFWLVSCT